MIVRDTVIVTKTKYLTDTLELYKDTTIYQDKVRLQLQYIDRKVLVEATCLPDTIRVTQTKILTKEKDKGDGLLKVGLRWLEIMETTTKVCTKCKVEKSLTEFYTRQSSKDGYMPSCKDCKKQYYHTNKANRKHYLTHKKEDISKKRESTI